MRRRNRNMREMVVTQKASHETRWRIEKFASDEDVKANIPFESTKVDGNALMNAGINLAWNLIAAQGGQGFDNANSYIGVGDNNTAADPTHTDLQAVTNKLRVGMNANYPTNYVGANQKITFQSDFTAAQANYAWNEFGVFNAAAAGTILNRKVSVQGSKTSGQTWRISAELTIV